MTEPTLTINLVLDNKTVEVPYTNTTTAEDVCIFVCKSLGIGPLARHLFALRIVGKPIFLTPSAFFGPKYVVFDLRIRFKVSRLQDLRKLDTKAYDYYFHQARIDLLKNKIPDIVFEKCKKELVGLGITDMYRVMLEKDIPKETVENDYRKYIPKEVLKRHAFFIKKPIRETLTKLQKTRHDVGFVKDEYLNQLNILAPDYLSETYKAVTDQDGSVLNILVKISPPNSCLESDGTNLAVLKYCIENKKEKWQMIGTIEDMAYVSIRIDGTVEISRTNGIPFYLKFNSLPVMWSFISHLDGYYRLSCKWTFNICKDAPTPSLQKLYMMKCHGPVGGEFSYAKLEEKRSNRPGSFIIRESETKYNQYFIDVCIKNSSKPKTFKFEKINKDEYIFNDDLTRYRNIQQLISAYNNPNGPIFLQECLPPSEYDKSPLLLCHKENLSGTAVADASSITALVPKVPICIDCNDLQVYKYRNCLKWNKDRNNLYQDGHTVKREKFDKVFFPDPDLSSAGKKCRNPDGDAGGPWCYVENEPENTVEKDYCDIPPCDEPVCVVFTKDHDTYTHFTDFNDTLDSLNFGVKLWSSDRYLEAEARLVLSVMALPIGKEEMEDLGTSIEVFISNRYCALTVNNKDEVEREVTKGILSSIRYTYFTLTWHRGFITLTKDGVTKPVFIAEYKTKNNLMGFKMDRFSYYAAQGTDILWTFPFCLDDFECDVHTTTGHLFQQYWPLRATSIGRELSTRVRAVRSARISLSPTPTNPYPNVVFDFRADDGYTRVVLEEYKNAPALTLKEVVLTDALDYWKWQEYAFSFFGDTFQVHWTKNGAAHLILEAKHPSFRKMRWYSVCSDNSVAHWTFFCVPPESAQPPPAFLPECSMNPQELNYAGRQDVTHDGFPCLPWSAKKLVPDLERKFFEGDAFLEELSYCRDPGKYQKGTYCYVISTLPEKTVLKKYCRLRKCKSQECRMAGTGNDYTGALNTARSRRYCEPWYSLSYVHQHDQRYLNDSLFADLKLEDANNYCRNPSRNPVGSWCYTIDPNVPQESCSVKDCDKPEECIVILTGNNEGRRIYLLPQWKERGAHGGLQFALKRWNPERVEGVGLEITPRDGAGSIRLEIGAEGNQKVNLYHDGVLTKEKTLPHLIASGTWTEFWLQIRREEIMLGYKGVPHSLFEWKPADIASSFDPTYVSFSTLNGEYVGVYFKCDECHTERLSVNNVLQVYPVGVWREDEEVFGDFSLKIRGSGTVWVPLYNLIHTGDYLLLELNQVRSEVSLHRSADYQTYTLKVVKNATLFAENRWSDFTVHFTETALRIATTTTTRNVSETILEYTAPAEHPILIYHFALGVDNGEVIWSANCDRLDVDGPPRDGGWSGWSDWTCSVPCGGGDGFRTRSCTNPAPNVRGRLCVGAPMVAGRCNDFECGDISPKTADRIREDLRTNFFSFVVEENEDITVPIDKKILRAIVAESPKAEYEWTLNGMVVNEEDERFSMADGEILVTGAKPADSVQRKHGSQGITLVHRCMWKIEKSKKVEVAMKLLKQDCSEKYLKNFLDLAGSWTFLQSKNIVKIYGITLSPNVSMVMEYFRLGPLNTYLRKNRNMLKTEDLIEASSNLASALWYLSERRIVHGNIRCRKLMVHSHDTNAFIVKLMDPGIHTSYGPNEVHWIPVECYSNLDYARRSSSADVWAFATTLFEIFTYGEEINVMNPMDAKEMYKNGKILPKPPPCPENIYHVMKECWFLDADRRKHPQAIMRDINQILYQVYNSRRVHSYAKLFAKSKVNGTSSVSGTSTSSLVSNYTESTCLSQTDEILISEEREISETSSYTPRLSECALLSSQDFMNHEDTLSCNFSNILSSFNFPTSVSSLDSMNSLQSIFELDECCNVVLQGRIGQGFYGEVYKATLEYYDNTIANNPRQVAVKKLKTSGISSSLQDFEREINIMKTLQHPNIIEILGVVRDPEILLIMEFVPHGSLQSYLKIYKDSLHTKQLLNYALDITKGMHYLGQKNIVHRDLAARNILVVDENHIKISDFGLAQAMGTNEYYILKTNRELPIKWYAPESLRDGKFSVRSDVWSFGVTMCEMFNCGEEPKLTNIDEAEQKGQEQEILLNALATGARFPCPPMCPQAVYIRIIYPCWHNDPHERPSFSKLISETEDLLTQY